MMWGLLLGLVAWLIFGIVWVCFLQTMKIPTDPMKYYTDTDHKWLGNGMRAPLWYISRPMKGWLALVWPFHIALHIVVLIWFFITAGFGFLIEKICPNG